MGRIWNFGSHLFLFALILTACNRNGRAPSSAVSISVSQSTLARIKSSLPANTTPCFGISVSGTSSALAAANKCSPAVGAVVGYVGVGANGEDINATVDANQTVQIDLYMFLMPGAGGTCPAMTAAFPVAQLPNTYLVASTSVLVGTSAPPPVDLTVNYPVANIAAALPTTCTGGSTGGYSPIGVSAGEKTISGGNVIMKANIGATVNPQTLTGSNYNAIVR